MLVDGNRKFQISIWLGTRLTGDSPAPLPEEGCSHARLVMTSLCSKTYSIWYDLYYFKSRLPKYFKSGDNCPLSNTLVNAISDGLNLIAEHTTRTTTGNFFTNWYFMNIKFADARGWQQEISNINLTGDEANRGFPGPITRRRLQPR